MDLFTDAINKNTFQLIANELIASLYRKAFMNTDMNQYLIFGMLKLLQEKLKPISCIVLR